MRKTLQLALNKYRADKEAGLTRIAYERLWYACEKAGLPVREMQPRDWYETTGEGR